MLEIKALEAFKDNYIWTIINKSKHEAFIVDPGQAKPVLDYFHAMALNLRGILITHHHPDHSAGVPTLLKYWPQVKVYASYKSTLPFITQSVKEGDSLKIFNKTLKVLEIPGHTLDHIAFYNHQILFCGDTLFSFGCGKVFEGTPEQMYQSLDKLSQLGDKIKIYCGHEYTLSNLRFLQHVEPKNPFLKDVLAKVLDLRLQKLPTLPSSLHEEKRLNPFLRCDTKDVIDAVEKYTKKKYHSPVDIFAALREWKNHFII